MTTGRGLVDLFRSIEDAWTEIRAIKSQLDSFAAGGSVRATSIVGVLPPTAGGSGAGTGSIQLLPRFANDSGGNLAEGVLVVLDAAGGREITTTTTASDPLAIGVVRGDGAPYADAAETPVLVLGYHAAVVVEGAVAIGDYLASSTTAGAAASVGTSPGLGVIGIALSANGGGSGTVEAFILPIGSAASSPALSTGYIPFGTNMDGSAVTP